MRNHAAPKNRRSEIVQLGAYFNLEYSAARSPISIVTEPSGSWTSKTNCARATLQVAPEISAEANFRELLESAFETIDGVLRSIPKHLKRRGFQIAVETVGQNDDFEAFALKAHARREIDMLKREHALQLIQKEKEVSLAKAEAKDKTKVWVVHGRNLKARDAMFSFLRSIGLEPMEWGEALALTGKGTP